MNYKNVANAINFAKQEAREARNEVSCISENEEINIYDFAKLTRVIRLLDKALEEL